MVRVVSKEPRIPRSNAIPEAHKHRVPGYGNAGDRLRGIGPRGSGKDVTPWRIGNRSLAGSHAQPIFPPPHARGPAKGQGGGGQGRARRGRGHGWGKGAAATTAICLGLVRVVSKEPRIPRSNAIPEAHKHRVPGYGNAGDRLRGIGPRGSGKDVTPWRIGNRSLAGSHAQPIFPPPHARGPAKGQGGGGQGRARRGRGHGWGKGAAATAAAADLHGVGMVLRRPRATTVFGPPPNMDGATGREPRDRGGMAGAQGATVMKVFCAHAGADIEPVFRILSGVPPGKGHGGGGQGRARRGRGQGRGKGAAATAAAATTAYSSNLFFRRSDTFVS